MKMVPNSLKGSLGQITKLSCKTGKRYLSAVAAGTWQGLSFEVITVVIVHLKTEAVFIPNVNGYIPDYTVLYTTRP
jgi:hypothetical protein